MITFNEFRNLPPEEIAKHAPASIIFAAGGTRRAAKLKGIHDQDEYVQWSSKQLIECFGLFAKFGVRHIITHAIVPTQWMEITPGYREKLVEWIDSILTSSETVEEYRQREWRESMIGTDSIPELKHLRKKLLKLFPKSDARLTVYYTATPTYDSPWADLRSSLKKKWKTQDDLILTQYKEAIPPVKLYIGYGKPVLSAAVSPPLLGAFDGVHAYWLQKPGFLTDERGVLSIIYDYAFTRQTWMRDKSQRTEQILNHRTEITKDRILGLGKRLGPFWYPD